MKIHSAKITRIAKDDPWVGGWMVTWWEDGTYRDEFYTSRNEARELLSSIKRSPDYVPGKCFVALRVIEANSRHEAAAKLLSLVKRQRDKFVRVPR